MKLHGKGKKNIYMCKRCGRGFVSIDLDDGVTPFLMSCLTDGCKELAASFFYQAPQDLLADISPAVEWYKPDAVELAGLTGHSREHVLKGGLLSRKVQP